MNENSTIGIVTDSASQIPRALADQLDVAVVPIVVAIDGTEYREGVDLDPDDFWARIVGGVLPEVTTSQPSPGAIAEIYRSLEKRGITEIVSVHVGADVSGTVNSAMLAADTVDAKVIVVDSGTASFGVAACVWEAAAVRDAGASAEAVADRARAFGLHVATTFILQAFEFARAGGRIDTSGLSAGPDEPIMVLGGVGTRLEVTGEGRTIDELCEHMASSMLAAGVPIRAAVSLADDATLPFTVGIEERLRASDLVVDMVRYRVGPSIAAHTGPGTAGGFWWPVS